MTSSTTTSNHFDRDEYPGGYYIAFSNNRDCPKWLVMRWGVIYAVCDTIDEACHFLKYELGGQG